MSSDHGSIIQNQQIPHLPDKKIGIVSAAWHAEIVQKLLVACKETLGQAGIPAEHIWECEAPGSFEIPVMANWLDKKHSPDAIICLGCVIKGETDHDQYINQTVANALMQMGLMRDKPFIFGVLTVLNETQAHDRAGGKHGNKGRECAIAALKMLVGKDQLFENRKKIGFI